MSQRNSETMGEIQLPQCSICNLQPIPESVQFVPFIMLEVFLAFISLKLLAIFVLFSYCFTRNGWFCPQCKRQIDVIHQVPGVSENLIIRMGNCMFVLSKVKFRVIAAILVSYLVYLYVIEIHQTPHVNVEKTWYSLATNCGYEAFLQNSYRANTVYGEYPQLGEWTISGIYLREQAVTNHVSKIMLKMNPSQFKNADTEDVAVVITSHTLFQDKNVAIGDIVQVRGQWQGRQAQGHLLKFSAMKVHKTGGRMDPKEVTLLPSAQKFIKSHTEQSIRGKNLASEKVKTIVMNN